MKTENGKSRAPLGAKWRRRLAELIKVQGEESVRSAMGIKRETLARALAGLSVQAGTRALVERFFESTETRGAI